MRSLLNYPNLFLNSPSLTRKRSLLSSFDLQAHHVSFRPVFDNGKLTYTSVNAPVHAYVDALEKLLIQLDGIQSEGCKRVKERRKEVVHLVESELEKVESWKKAFTSSADPESTEKDQVEVALSLPLPPSVESLALDPDERDVEMESEADWEDVGEDNSQ